LYFASKTREWAKGGWIASIGLVSTEGLTVFIIVAIYLLCYSNDIITISFNKYKGTATQGSDILAFLYPINIKELKRILIDS
jgi:hypothetical protein